jgi:hypothetical protein
MEIAMLILNMRSDLTVKETKRIIKFAESAIKYLSLEKEVVLTLKDDALSGPDGYHDFKDGVHKIEFSKVHHLATLAHEFIHASQTERGDLVIDGEKTYWKGNLSNKRYIDQEWEIEAFDLQDQLAGVIIIGENL